MFKLNNEGGIYIFEVKIDKFTAKIGWKINALVQPLKLFTVQRKKDHKFNVKQKSYESMKKVNLVFLFMRNLVLWTTFTLKKDLWLIEFVGIDSRSHEVFTYTKAASFNDWRKEALANFSTTDAQIFKTNVRQRMWSYASCAFDHFLLSLEPLTQREWAKQILCPRPDLNPYHASQSVCIITLGLLSRVLVWNLQSTLYVILPDIFNLLWTTLCCTCAIFSHPLDIVILQSIATLIVAV